MSSSSQTQTRGRPRPEARTARHPRRRHPWIEPLESRQLLSWGGVPPATIPLPPSVVVTLDNMNDAQSAASIASNEVDYYTFVAPSSGPYVVKAEAPSSNLDTVLGVFGPTGQRLAYNDDISYPTNRDSSLAVNLQAGLRYFVGVTNYTGTPGGAYTLSVNGPNEDYTLTRTGPWGGSGGSPFDDREYLPYFRGYFMGDVVAPVQIARMSISSGSFIDSIQVTYTNNSEILGQPRRHGGGGGSRRDLVLQPGEYIIAVSGRYGDYVDSLTIRTGGSRSQIVTWGGTGGARSFNYVAPPGTQIFGIWGSSGQYVDRIGLLIARRGTQFG